ncbi:MAG: hypothetical protein E7382_02440 [Clostridiales bacterium]|nr:hypothetical protein [Clostridiales bacterium]
MTRNSNIKKSKWSSLLTLLLIGMLCFTLFFATACGNDEEEESFKVPSYNYSETTDSGVIKNNLFSYATENFAIKDMPKTSVSGWSRSSDNGMTSTSAKSGVINVSDEGWEKIVNKLYDDSYFINYFKVMYGMETADIQDEIKQNNESDKTPTTTQVKNYFIENYICSDKPFTYDRATVKVNSFGNPGKYSEEADDNVYMLNNYLTKNSVGLGTAQSIKSDSIITLKKGGYGKLTVWVKTQNVGGSYGDGTNYGANIVLSNTLDSSSQADFGIFNIVAEDWTMYTIYVQADETYDTSFSVNLGLGYDKYSATEGTVYFDDVQFTPLTAEEFANENVTSAVEENITYNSEEPTKVLAKALANGTATPNPALYNMSIADSLIASGYLNDLTVNKTEGYTLSEKTDLSGNKISGGRFDTQNKTSTTAITLNKNQFPYSAGATEINVNNASYTLTYGSKTNAIEVKAGEYSYVEFYVKNQLSKFSATDITVDVYDVNGEIVKKVPAIATVSETSDDWSKISFVVKNNFESGDRAFYYSVIIGPTNVVSAEYALDYANGKVTMTSPKIAFGKIEQYDNNGNETDNYDIYSLFLDTANGKTALYAGNTGDFSKPADSETYNFTVAPSDIGVIESNPAVPQGYQGVVADHFYIKEDGTERDINTKITKDKTAGLINTKYLDKYTELKDVKTALNFNDGDEDFQPLVIYNKDADHYGLVGKSNTISPSSYAKVSVKLRVTGGATAYIYLVDTSEAHKEVMTFSDFVANVNSKGEDVENGKEYDGNAMKLLFAVTEATMAGEDWVTVEFYVGTGATEKDFRLEIWNGGRDGSDATASKGYVFVSEATVSTSSAFSEPSSWKNAFTVSGNPLYEIGKSEFDNENLILYKRELTDIEKKYNEEYDDDVSYSATYVWAKNDTFIYAVYNTIDPKVTNPYDNIKEEEEVEESGCNAETEPAAFWLSFSSVLLAAVLFLAILALITKNIRRRRKANRSDAKSHYKITSRTKGKTTEKKSWFARFKSNDDDDDDEDDEVVEEIVEEQTEIEEVTETEEAQETQEQNLDEYVYGEVQDFGEDAKEDSTDKTKE